MKTKVFTGVLVVALLLASVPLASAADPAPAIIVFSSSLDTVTVNEIEAGTAMTTLSWHTVGMTGEHRLTLHMYHQNKWVPVFADESVPLEPVGSREVTLEPTLNFGPPTYLLSIIDSQSRVLDQRTLTIPYDMNVGATEIAMFEADVESVNASELAAGSLLVNLSWDVTNRPATSNLVFEQVFADGSTLSVELPRPNLWVPSAANGPVAPVYHEGEDTIVLRLRVVDLVTDDVYAEQELTLMVTGTAAVPPSTPEPGVPPAGPPQVGVPVSADVVSFTATPNTVNPGAAVTLAWEVRGIGGVTIQETVPGIEMVQTVVNAQSPKGSATVYLPDYAAYSVTFTLTPASQSTSAQATVNVHCPYAFFFGQGDGCPSTQPLEIEAAYEKFEGGFMVWRGDTKEIYVFYSDGAAAYFLESSYNTLPEQSPDVAPPLERYAPVSGFGRVWANTPVVADKLGWALAPEEGYTMTLQQVALTRSPHPQYNFYLTLPDGSVIGSGYGRWSTVSTAQ